MATDLTIVVADVTRRAAIKSGLKVSGRVEHFTNSNLASAFEAIQAQAPRVIAVDAILAQTQQGAGFIKRVEALAIPECTIRLIMKTDGTWATTPREAQPATEPTIIAPTIIVPAAKAPTVIPAPNPPGAASVAAAAANAIRRAPRFPLVSTLNAGVEGGQASLVNISVLGAQLVSKPVLRPGQTLKVALPDANDMLRLTANVAWSTLQQTPDRTVVYRAGIAFTDAAQEMLDDYCRRYGAAHPLPSY